MGKQIIVCEPRADIRLEVTTDGETVWLTQGQMCRLFGRDQSVMARRIRNVFKEGVPARGHRVKPVRGRRPLASAQTRRSLRSHMGKFGKKGA